MVSFIGFQVLNAYCYFVIRYYYDTIIPTTYEIDYLPGIATNVLPHHVDDCSADERVLNDERIQIRSGVSYDSAHNWVPSAHRCVIDVSDQGRWVQGIERLEDFRVVEG